MQKDDTISKLKNTGTLARQFGGLLLELAVLKSPAGYYLGTLDEGLPYSRESREYWRTREEAEAALESDGWTQRPAP